jgi:enoyl-CoA hydratase/carnithine racemase
MSKLAITRENGIARVTIDNPPANILTVDLINEVNTFVLSLKDDRDIKAVVFSSMNELFFLAHLDLNVINGTAGGQAACIEFSHMINNIKAMKPLSIAIVDGVARGGGNELVCCHG